VRSAFSVTAMNNIIAQLEGAAGAAERTRSFRVLGNYGM